MSSQLVVVAVALLTATQVAALVQLPVPGLPPNQSNNKGRLFCTAFLENTPGGGGNLGQMRLYITTDEPIPIQFRIDFGSGPPFNQMSIPSASGTAMPNQYTMVNVPSIVELGSTGGENGHLTYGVQIVGINGDISVYAVHDDQKSSDGWLVLPQDNHPDVSQYRYVTFSSLLDAGDQFARNTIFAVPVCYDQDPSPSLTLSMTVPNEYPMTPEHTINLANFVIPGRQTFTPGNTVSLSVFSTVRTSFFISGPKPDLTGWRVSTNHQVGVVTGHACGRAPVNATACDHLAEQVPPTYTWGYHVFTAPQSQRFGEMYRIQSRGIAVINITCNPENSTIPNSVNTQTIDPSGEYFYEFVTSKPMYCCIESEEPIIVMQYSVGHSHDENTPGKTFMELGDPFMILIPPVEQYINNITFTTDLRVNDQFNRGDYISITVPIQYFNPSMIVLDDNDLSGQQWHRIYCSNGEVCGMGTNMPVSRAFHRIAHLNPNAVFFVEIYGWGDETSWGFPGGYARSPIGLPIFRIQGAQLLENAGPARVTVLRSGDTRTEASIVVSIRASTGALQPGLGHANIPNDVPLFSMTIPFPVRVTSQTVSIPIVDDTEIESNEVFEVHLTKVTTSNSPDVVVGVPNSAEVVIVDNDRIILQFNPTVYSVVEGVNFATNLTIVASGSIQGPTVVRVTHIPGSAQPVADYVAFNTTVTFPVGQTSIRFPVDFVNDNIFELPESLQARLTIESGNGVQVGLNNIATINITDNDDIQAQFQEPMYRVQESVGNAIVTVTLNRQSSVPIPLIYSTISGTATAPSDYTGSTNRRIVIPANTQTFDISIPIENDAIFENNEQFSVQLALAADTPSGVTTGSPNPTTVQILDNDNIQAQFQAPLYRIQENAGNATVTVTLNRQSSVPIPLMYSTISGTATAPSDYSGSTNQRIVIPANTQTFDISIPIESDNTLESNEQFRVQLALAADTPSRVTTGSPNPTTVEILDDDSITINFDRPTFVFNESAGMAVLVVRTNRPSSVPIPFFYSTMDGSATAPNDYTARINQQLNFPRDTTQFTFTIPIRNDQLHELTEMFQVRLILPAEGGVSNVNLGTPNPATVQIIDDDSIVARFERELYVYNENVGQGRVGVVLSGRSAEDINLEYVTMDGTATAPMDYTAATPQVFTISAGSNSTVISIPINDDFIHERVESFQARLSLSGNTAPGVSVGSPDLTTVRITDNDNLVVEFERTAYSVNESSGIVTLRVVTSNSSAVPTVLNIQTRDGSANAPSDYASLNRNITIPAGETRFPVTINIANDEVNEPLENFQVRLSTLPGVTTPGVTTGSRNPATVQIIDDDVASVRFDRPLYQVNEGDGQATVNVVLSRPSDVPVMLAFGTQPDTARVVADFTPRLGIITIPPGITTFPVSINITDDTVSEPVERFTARLMLLPQTTRGITLGTPSTTVVQISDNDAAVVNFSSDNVRVDEDNGTVTVCLVKSGPTSRDLQLNVTSRELTPPDAVAPGDFIAETKTIVFPANSNEVCTSFPIINDATALEGVEEFQVTFTVIDGPGSNGERTTSTVQIVDDDMVTVEFQRRNYRVNEGDGTVQVCLTKSAQTTMSFTATISPQTGTASTEDFTSSPVMVTFGVNDTLACANISITDDTIVEPNENFDVTFSVPGDVSRGTIQMSTVTIIDNDGTRLDFTQSDYRIPEDEGPVQVCVRLTLSLSNPLPVRIEAQDVVPPQARDGLDYESGNARDVVIPPGQTMACANFTIIDDRIAQEPDEMFEVMFSIPETQARLVNVSDPTSTVTIVDDDMVAVRFASRNYTVNENGGPVRVCLRKDMVTANDFLVVFMPQPGSAAANLDYNPTPLTVPFGMTANMACADIPIIDDNFVEPSEMFRVTFTSLSNIIQSTPQETVVTILDNDGTRLEFTQEDYAVNEPDGPVQVCTQLTGVNRLSIPLTVRISAQDLVPVEAMNGNDYQAGNPRDVVIPPRGDMACTNFTIIDDNVALEPNERFRVSFSIPNAEQSALVETPDTTSTVTILDNDDNVVVDFVRRVYMTTEGDNPQLCLRLNVEAIARPVTVRVEPKEQTASEADYIPRTFNQTIEFSAGGSPEEPLQQCFRGSIVDDNIHEQPESLIVEVVPLTPGVTTGVNVPATVTIGDNDRLVIVGDNTTVIEDMGPARVCVRYMSPVLSSSQNVTIRLTPRQKESAPREATIGADFSGDIKMVTIMAGSSMACVEINIVDDNIQEGSEQFCVDLQIVNSVSNAEIAGEQGCQACVTIRDPQIATTEKICRMRSPLMISPFRSTSSSGEGSSYNFRGTCEHVLVKPCNDMPRIAVVGDFLSEDLSMGRVGIRNGTKAVVLTEQLGLELRGDLPSSMVGSVTTTNLGSLEVVVTVGEGMVTLVASDAGIMITRTSNDISIMLDSNTITQSCGLCGNTSGALVFNDGRVANIMNRTMVEAFANSWLVRPSEQTLRDDRMECAVILNDTVIGDPLFKAVGWMPQQMSHINLCYEIHGAANQVFSLVSDVCVAVNALYAPMNNSALGNIIQQVGIVAVDSSNNCHNITVTLTNGQCRTRRVSNGVNRDYSTSFEDNFNGVAIRQRTLNRVRVSVPNCERVPLVMWVVCETVNEQQMIRFEISRGVNLRPTSHGLLAQFWNVPVIIQRYNGSAALPEDYNRDMVFVVTVTPPSGHSRRFIGERFARNWDNSAGPCIYVGNAQGGPSGELEDPNDSVIEPSYTSYRLSGLHHTEFAFKQFRDEMCPRS